MKNRRKTPASPEEAFYRSVESHMDLPLNYHRIRSSLFPDEAEEAETSAAAPPPARRRGMTWAAVAATLALVGVLVGSGAWIADRLRQPPVPLPPADSVFQIETTPDTPSETPSDTLPETVPSHGAADAPDKMTIRGIVYYKTEEILSEEELGSAIGQTHGSREEMQPSVPYYLVPECLPGDCVAIQWRDVYVIYRTQKPANETE